MAETAHIEEMHYQYVRFYKAMRDQMEQIESHVLAPVAGPLLIAD